MEFVHTGRWTDRLRGRLSDRHSDLACGGLQETSLSWNEKNLSQEEEDVISKCAYLDYCLGSTGWTKGRHSTGRKVDRVR